MDEAHEAFQPWAVLVVGGTKNFSRLLTGALQTIKGAGACNVEWQYHLSFHPDGSAVNTAIVTYWAAEQILPNATTDEGVTT